MTERDNSQWIADLSEAGPLRAEALEDLRLILTRGLTQALHSYARVTPADVDDFVQEALLKILDNLETFRGESRFTTWAHKIAVHEAISELRRLRWRDVPLIQQNDDGQEVEIAPDTPQRANLSGQPEAGPERRALQEAAMETLRRALREDLTERQRQVMQAVLVQGLPLEEVARRMDTNRNALYKLMHDARQKLKRSLLTAGSSAAEILEAFEAR